MAAVARVDLPALAFDATGFRIDFGEIQALTPKKQRMDEFDQAAGLLELLVFLEQCDDVFEPRVKRIGRCDFVGDGFRTPAGNLGLGSFREFPPVGVGDVLDLGLVG